MADKHPYVNAPAYITKVLSHLRRSFPAKVTANTLKKLGIAPKNESYTINVLKFLDLIDKEGNRTEKAAQIFSQHDDASFAQQFSEAVKQGYSELFDLHGDDAWQLDSNSLIAFFRSSDQTSAVVGKYQASTFHLLAAYSGYRPLPEVKTAKSNPVKETGKQSNPKNNPPGPKGSPPSNPPPAAKQRTKDIGLTVRIEINLPADGDQLTYDRIFKSIRENFLSE